MTRRTDRGFTLVETMAAVLVLAIVTLGIFPLLAASLRGSNTARSSNIAKSIAVKAMERIRGLPFYVDYATQPTNGTPPPARTDVDVLDLYLPGPTNPASGAGIVTTVCTPAGVTPVTAPRAACPGDIQQDYAVTFEARFVRDDGTTTVPIPNTYDSNAVALDEAPSPLVRMTVRVTWDAVLGRTRTYSLTSLVGNRAFGRLMQGEAVVNHAVRVDAQFSAPDSVPDEARLSAVVGSGRSEIEQRARSSATQNIDSAILELFNLADPANPVIADVRGPVLSAVAPPNQGALTDVQGTAGTITFGGVGPVAGLDEIVAGQPTPEGDGSVTVLNELPSTKGGFSFEGLSSTLDFWVDHPQADRTTGPGAALQLIPGAKLLSVDLADNTEDADTVEEPLRGWTALATQTKASGGVQGDAHVDFEQLRLFPVAFVEPAQTTPSYGRALVVVEEFTSDVSCDAFSTPAAGTGLATASWSAVIRFWAETGDNDGIPQGGYQRVVLSGTAGTDPLSGIGSAVGQTNPLVFDAVDDADDLYLFEDPTNARRGYLTSWRSDPNMTNNATVSPDGSRASAKLDGVISIDTIEIPSDGTDFPFNVTVGSLECESLDFR